MSSTLLWSGASRRAAKGRLEWYVVALICRARQILRAEEIWSELSVLLVAGDADGAVAADAGAGEGDRDEEADGFRSLASG